MLRCRPSVQRAPQPAQRHLVQRPSCLQSSSFSSSASDPPAASSSCATPPSSSSSSPSPSAPISPPSSSSDLNRFPRDHRRPAMNRQERWHAALERRNIGAAIEALKQENSTKASAWTMYLFCWIMWAAGKSGVPAHVLNTYSNVDPSAKRDPIFWSAVFSACRQPGMGLSEFALRACEDMLPEYKSSWEDNMTQVLVNLFIALMASEQSPQLAGVMKMRDWAKTRSLLAHSEIYSALVFSYTRRKRLNDLIAVLDEAAAVGILIHPKNLSEAINALVLGNRPSDAFTWVKYAATAGINVDGASLNNLHRQLYAMGHYSAAKELEALFETFKHKPDLKSLTKLMLAMSSASSVASLPRVIALFDQHVKPIVDQEAYATIIRICGRAQRGDLVSKYWREAWAWAQDAKVQLTAKFWDGAADALVASDNREDLSQVLSKVPLESLSDDTVAKVTPFLMRDSATQAAPFLQRLETLAKSGKGTREILNSLLECYAIAGNRNADTLAVYQYYLQRSPADETTFCFLLGAITTTAEYEQQLERLYKELKEQGPRLLITDRTRGAIIKALLRLGVKVDEAKARAQDLAPRFRLPPPSVHSSEAVVLHKIAHASSAAELKVAESEVMHLANVFRAVVMQSGMKQVLDKALHSAAARLKDPEMISQYAQQLKGRRPLVSTPRKNVHT